MTYINDMVAKYISLGYNNAEAKNLASEEIILRKISASDMVD